MPQIETARTTLNISDHRQPDATSIPTLLIHGAGGSRLVWPGEIRRRPEASTIAIDLPGHGKSPGNGRTSIAEYAADTVALLDALNIPQAVVCGHSMGGAIAQTLALDFSDRVAGVILISTGAKLRVHPDLLQHSQTNIEAAADLLDQWLWASDFAGGHRMAVRAQLLDLAPGTLHNDYTATNAFDIRDRIHEIAVPTLIIGSTDDRMTPLKFSTYLHENIPDSALHTIDGAGHYTILEQPRTIAAHINTWLQQHIQTTNKQSEG